MLYIKEIIITHSTAKESSYLTLFEMVQIPSFYEQYILAISVFNFNEDFVRFLISN